MSKPRAIPRFTIGQRVRINHSITSRYTEQQGTIVAVKPNFHSKVKGTTLDKYTVSFSDDEQADFFDSQLKSA